MAEKAAVLVDNLRGSVREPEAETPEREGHEKDVRHEGDRLAPRYAFRAFHDIVAQLKGAPKRVLLLDLDGTLVGLRRRPRDVRVSQKAKRILQRLASVPNLTVAILSGRDAQSLERLITVRNVRCFGLHGSEEQKRATRISREARQALRKAKRSAQQELAGFSGVAIEDKGSAFSVHYRGADVAAVRGANQTLLAIVAPLRHALHILNGKKVWEVLPRQIPGKGSAMKRLLAASPKAALAYIGDDEPDEPAFAALEGHVTIHVGNNRETHARFYLRNPGEVLRFLGMLERELK
jgi:trehalose-phosphatase